MTAATPIGGPESTERDFPCCEAPAVAPDAAGRTAAIWGDAMTALNKWRGKAEAAEAEVERLREERDRARAVCGHEKAMRRYLHDELSNWIGLRSEALDRAEAAEARVVELEAALQRSRDDHQAAEEKLAALS